MDKDDYLVNFRKQIDRIDNEILILLKRRFQLSKKIAKYKVEHKVQVEDLSREDEIFRTLVKQGTTMQLRPNFIRKLFDEIITESKHEQQLFIEKRKLNEK